jgi:hypothetical protein
MFLFVIVAVGIIGIALACTAYFRPGRALQQLGHQGSAWFAHADDDPIAERASEDDCAAPLPHRPIRTRQPEWIAHWTFPRDGDPVARKARR